MKRTAHFIALTLVLATPLVAKAESRIAKLCGQGHVNEVISGADVRPNPVGYFVTSLHEQVSERDPRIILSTVESFYLCTGSAATPDMDASKALLLLDERVVKYLFVPEVPRATGS